MQALCKFILDERPNCEVVWGMNNVSSSPRTPVLVGTAVYARKRGFQQRKHNFQSPSAANRFLSDLGYRCPNYSPSMKLKAIPGQRVKKVLKYYTKNKIGRREERERLQKMKEKQEKERKRKEKERMAEEKRRKAQERRAEIQRKKLASKRKERVKMEKKRQHEKKRQQEEKKRLENLAFVAWEEEEKERERQEQEKKANKYVPRVGGHYYTRLARSKFILSTGRKHMVCVFLADGTVFSMGLNNHGMLGVNDKITREVFTEVLFKNDTRIVSADCDGYQSIFVCSKGKVYVCGNDLRSVKCGDLDFCNPYIVPLRPLPSGVRITKAFCGSFRLFILSENGEVFCMGDNEKGQLGDGTTRHRGKLTRISSVVIKKILSVSCGRYHTFFLGVSGKVWCVGGNSKGQLGINSYEDQKKPRLFSFNSKISQIATGRFHSLLLVENGKVWGAGCNKEFQLGFRSQETQNERKLVVIRLPHGQLCSSIGCGDDHSGFVTKNGSLYVCGRNHRFQLGLGLEKENVLMTKVDVGHLRVTGFYGGFTFSVITVGEGNNSENSAMITGMVHCASKTEYESGFYYQKKFKEIDFFAEMRTGRKQPKQRPKVSMEHRNEENDANEVVFLKFKQDEFCVSLIEFRKHERLSELLQFINEVLENDLMIKERVKKVSKVYGDGRMVRLTSSSIKNVKKNDVLHCE